MNIKESLEEFYENLLGVEYPWLVESIRRDSKKREVTVIVGYSQEEPCKCPVCGKRGKLHDHHKRRWRHLDSCNHKTFIEAQIPRVSCEEHGVKPNFMANFTNFMGSDLGFTDF